MSPSATLDIGYRYLNTGHDDRRSPARRPRTLKNSNVSQDIRIGIRYMAD